MSLLLGGSSSLQHESESQSSWLPSEEDDAAEGSQVLRRAPLASSDFSKLKISSKSLAVT